MTFVVAIFRRYAHVALFVVCEIIAFVLIINFNQKQKEIFLHSSSLFSGAVFKKSAQLSDYMSLQQSNNDLLQENARLLKEIINMPAPAVPSPDTQNFAFEVIPARVINNSIQSLRNHLTIDKGLVDGIGDAMGASTVEGVVGIVKSANDRYATLLSLLNVDIRISASLADADFFGTISWDGRNYDQLTLTGIPIHASAKVGDEVMTNGYSTIFPKGLKIGEISSVTISKNGAFYDILVKPEVDFSSLGHVYVLKGNFTQEILSLEEDE